MRIAHIVLPGASEYEKKSQRADASSLSGRHEIVLTTVEEAGRSGASIAHVYASAPLPPRLFTGFPLPYVSSADLAAARFSLRRSVAPRYLFSPLATEGQGERLIKLPEGVEEIYFASRDATPGSRETKIVGSYDRPALRNAVEQTVARISRFRSDVTWHLFDHIPTPHDLAGVDLWVDSAITDDDWDGFVAEALVVGLPVVATRTPINVLRLEQGRTGWLVPRSDPNEMTHAILAALFKTEVAENRRIAARQTISKFQPRQRTRVLTSVYDTLTA